MPSSAALLEAVFTPPQGPREAGSDRAQRLRHIQCALLLLGGQFAPGKVADLFDLSRAGAYLWRDRALTYHDDEAEALRRIVLGGGRARYPAVYQIVANYYKN